MTRFLVDTSAFLWSLTDDSRLGTNSRSLLSEHDNDPILSVVSAWEIAIKWTIGKLALPTTPERVVAEALTTGGYSRMVVDYAHAVHVATLPPIHNDPFDRLLVAQAAVERLPILTADPALGRYGTATIDART